jgi:NCS2 family nucleobase:cation symporter-2
VISLKKPVDLAYGVDERPPLMVSGLVAVQHVGIVCVNLVYPLLLAREAALSADATGEMLRIGMFALGLGVLVQAIPVGRFGCHYLAPMVYASPYLAPGILAIQLGGLPLFWGMTIVAGLATVGFASIWHRLRILIPSELAGLVVFLVGATIGIAALRLMHKPDGSAAPTEAAITLLSIVVMIILNVWTKGRLRLFTILIGIVVGYAVSLATGVLPAQDLAAIAREPLFKLPSIQHMSWSFDLSLVMPFVITALAVAMTTTAVVTTYQRITDAEWVRPDMRTISQGIRGDGIGTIIGGLLCSFGQAVGPANAGLVAATGVASRVIAYPIAILLILAAVQPAFTTILTIMPPSVMAAGLLFPSAFIMINGVQIISSRVLDARRTIVIGASILTFLMVAQFPQTFSAAPAWIRPIASSPLILATVVALALNLIFRIGIRRSVELSISTGSHLLGEVDDFIERSAGGWGARRDFVVRLKPVVMQAAETVTDLCEPGERARLVMTYDEFDLEVILAYRGQQLVLLDFPPSRDEVMEPGGDIRLAGYLIKRQADNVRTWSANGETILQLSFRQ